MITETLARRMENRTEKYRVEAVPRLCKGMPISYFNAFLHGFYIGCDGIEEIYQKMMQEQVRIYERRLKHMKAKSKGVNAKLKKAKTAKAKKALKAKK